MIVPKNILDRKLQGVSLRDWVPNNRLSVEDLSRRELCIAQVNDGRECELASMCARNNIPFFLPLLLHRRADEIESSISVDLLWNGYLFVCVDEETIGLLKNSSHVYDLHSVPNAPRVFSDLAEVGRLNAHDITQANPGTEIEILGGALGRSTGILDSMDDQGRVKVLLDIMGRNVRVISPEARVEPRSVTPVASLDKELEHILKTNSAVTVAMDAVNQELIRYLQRHPEYMYSIDPLKFEEVVAEILSDMGYQIRFTPRHGGDGGRDLFAVFPTPLGEVLTIIECKRYDPDNRIGPDIVERFLYTIRERDKASCGLIATTSFFTGPMFQVQDKYQWQLILKDFDAIREWLAQYGTWSSEETTGLWIPKL